MDRVLPILNSTGPGGPARTCVWMDAGAVSFRLCDHGFACDHCPFDAAMRGHAWEGADPERAAAPPWSFPADRLYTPGHSWIQVMRGARVRAGLDAFAARLLAEPRRLAACAAGTAVARGHPLLRVLLDGGEVMITAPVSGRIEACNAALDTAPGLLVAEPYTAGWIAELRLDRAGDLAELVNAEAARRCAELDLRRLRREVAFQLLAGAGRPGPEPDDGFLRAAAQLLGSDPIVRVARRFLQEPGR